MCIPWGAIYEGVGKDPRGYWRVGTVVIWKLASKGLIMSGGLLIRGLLHRNNKQFGP